MAKSLNERIASALSTDRVTVATLRETITLASAERDNQNGIAKRAGADSVDVTLGDRERDESARDAERAGRLAIGYSEAIEKLQVKLAAKLESEDRKSQEIERKAALAERDQLVERWREVPGVIAKLIDLFKATNANAERMRAAGVHDRDAEAEARDIPGNFSTSGVGQYEQYKRIKIPSWDSTQRCWPVEQARVVYDYGAEIRRSRVEREERQSKLKKEAEEHQRQHGHYQLTSQLSGCEPLRIPTKLQTRGAPVALFYGDPWVGELSHQDAKKLEAVSGLTVTMLSPVTAK